MIIRCLVAGWLALFVAADAAATEQGRDIEIDRPITPHIKSILVELFAEDVAGERIVEEAYPNLAPQGMMGNLEIEHAFVRLADGEAPMLVTLIQGSGLSGTAGQSLDIFRKGEAGWEDIGGALTLSDSIRVLERKDDGYRRIVIYYPGTTCLPEVTLIWNSWKQYYDFERDPCPNVKGGLPDTPAVATPVRHGKRLDIDRPMTPKMRTILVDAFARTPQLKGLLDEFPSLELDAGSATFDFLDISYAFASLADGEAPLLLVFVNYVTKSQDSCDGYGCPLAIFRKGKGGWDYVGGVRSVAALVRVLDRKDAGYRRMLYYPGQNCPPGLTLEWSSRMQRYDVKGDNGLCQIFLNTTPAK